MKTENEKYYYVRLGNHGVSVFANSEKEAVLKAKKDLELPKAEVKSVVEIESFPKK